ncbi:MAG: putative Zn-binding protein involved in type VI secretion [Myxococcota bacterium]
MGKAVARLGDDAKVPSDAHGCPACPHTCIGPHVKGSPDVFVNGMPCVRVSDPGIHSACCGPNTHTAQTGSGTVTVNGMDCHRKGDVTTHCGGTGKSIVGSGNVFAGG